MNDKLSKFQSSFSQLLDVEIPLRDLCYNEIYLFYLLLQGVLLLIHLLRQISYNTTTYLNG